MPNISKDDMNLIRILQALVGAPTAPIPTPPPTHDGTVDGLYTYTNMIDMSVRSLKSQQQYTLDYMRSQEWSTAFIDAEAQGEIYGWNKAMQFIYSYLTGDSSLPNIHIANIPTDKTLNALDHLMRNQNQS